MKYFHKDQLKILVWVGLLIVSAFSTAWGGIDDGLIAHYNFEDANDLAKDVSGNEYNGRNLGAESSVGLIGHAAYFNGESSIVIDKFKNYDWGGKLSVSFWFYRLSNPPPSAVKGVGLVNAGCGSTGAWSIRLWVLRTRNLTGGVASLANVGKKDFEVIVELGQWYHVAMVYDDGGTLKFFLNGKQQVGGGNDFGRIRQFDSPLTLGEMGACPEKTEGPSYHYGFLDEIRLYQRTLHPLDIQELYMQGVKPSAGISMTKPNALDDQVALKATESKFKDQYSGDQQALRSVQEVLNDAISPDLVEPSGLEVVASRNATQKESQVDSLPEISAFDSTPSDNDESPITTEGKIDNAVEETSKILRSSSPVEEASCCAILDQLKVDWLSGKREKAIRELDRMSQEYEP